MDIHCEKKFFESRFKVLTQIWSWFMRRRGYNINYVTTHLEPPKHLVMAYVGRPVKEVQS